MEDVLIGTVDMHMHTKPDVLDRSVTDIEAARQAQKCKMKAILIKCHETITGDRAQIAQEITGFPVFGGIALNHPTGGLNIHAVRTALDMKCKVVWMPTVHAVQYLKHVSSVPSFAKRIPKGLTGIPLVDGSGRLLKTLEPILDLLGERNATLATGHIGRDEALPLLEAAKKKGLKRLVVSHPLADFLDFTEEDLKSFVSEGIYLEHCFVFTTSQLAHPIPMSKIANIIRTIGCDKTIISSDGGQAINPPPVKMFSDFITQLKKEGFSTNDINTMAVRNPSTLLDLI
jgi:hypothetical protein